MPLGVHLQVAPLEQLGLRFLLRRGFLRIGAPQDRLDAFDEQALRERLPDEVVGAHLETEQFVDLLVLGGQEDDRQVGLLAQAAQQFHAVHARHLDVEDGEVGRVGLEPVERRRAVGIGLDPVALGFERQGHRCEDVAVVVNQGDGRHFRLSGSDTRLDPDLGRSSAPLGAGELQSILGRNVT